jgi:LPS export ABC transporter protein LptC
MIYRLLGALALAVLIGAIVVLSGAPRGVQPASARTPLHDPGYSARSARIVQTGPDGRPLYTLDAAQVQQQPDSDVVELQQVQLEFRDSSGDEWTARAVHGELAEASGVVQLVGDVHVEGTAGESLEHVQIATEHLSFDTRAQIVTTHDPVAVLMSGRTLEALGLTASLKERRVQLESGVHGSFLP